jgi:hypothetical protein
MERENKTRGSRDWLDRLVWAMLIRLSGLSGFFFIVFLFIFISTYWKIITDLYNFHSFYKNSIEKIGTMGIGNIVSSHFSFIK